MARLTCLEADGHRRDVESGLVRVDEGGVLGEERVANGHLAGIGARVVAAAVGMGGSQ